MHRCQTFPFDAFRLAPWRFGSIAPTCTQKILPIHAVATRPKSFRYNAVVAYLSPEPSRLLVCRGNAAPPVFIFMP